MNDLYTNSAEFLRAVMALRAMARFYRSLAHHAADFWSNEDVLDQSLRVPIDDEVRGVLQ